MAGLLVSGADVPFGTCRLARGGAASHKGKNSPSPGKRLEDVVLQYAPVKERGGVQTPLGPTTCRSL